MSPESSSVPAVAGPSPLPPCVPRPLCLLFPPPGVVFFQKVIAGSLTSSGSWLKCPHLREQVPGHPISTVPPSPAPSVHPRFVFLCAASPHMTCHLSYLFLIYFTYLFLGALGLRCCTRAFSSCGERGLLFVVVSGLVIVVASLVAEHGL